MTAQIIDGKAISQIVRDQWKLEAEKLKDKGIVPGLAVIIVGDNPASKVYVRNKIKACHDVGLHSEAHEMPEDTEEAVLLDTIRDLNENKDIHGILVQLPLPKHINEAKVLETISVYKDVDGFHLYNIGALVVGNTVFPPCTPYGVQCLLEHMDIPIEGQNAVVVGRSNIVGKPMAMMLLHKSATVSICTSKTRDLKQYTSMGARVTQFPSGSMPTYSECACWEIWRTRVFRYFSGIQSRGSTLPSAATLASKAARLAGSSFLSVSAAKARASSGFSAIV